MNPLASVTSSELQEARERGSFDFLELIVNRISESVAGELNGDTMARLTPEQITLWAYWIFRSEVLDGGHVQLIYNGYGPFIYRNPFAHVTHSTKNTRRKSHKNAPTKSSWQCMKTSRTSTTWTMPSSSTKKKSPTKSLTT